MNKRWVLLLLLLAFIPSSTLAYEHDYTREYEEIMRQAKREQDRLEWDIKRDMYRAERDARRAQERVEREMLREMRKQTRSLQRLERYKYDQELRRKQKIWRNGKYATRDEHFNQ